MDLTKRDSVIAGIKLRYSNEKEAVIAEMNKRIEAKTSETQGKVDGTSTSKLNAIKTELTARVDNMQNLVMFSNVVSGYITGTMTGNGAKKDQQGRNIASLAIELNSNDANKKIKNTLEAGGSKIEIPADTASGSAANTSFDFAGAIAPAEDKSTPQ
jgi:hypothetical protein